VLLLAALFGSSVLAQQEKPPPEEPPEEDAGLAVKEYSFNPLQAAREMKVGHFYAKKGSWRAAATRFEEATKWEPGNVEAWLKLGEMREKLKDDKGAREAYSKYLDLAPDAKNAAALKKKVAGKS
jgi:Flp pilus assembly protein TadD